MEPAIATASAAASATALPTPTPDQETPKKQSAKRQKLEETLVSNISQLTNFITQRSNQQTSAASADDADKFGTMVSMQYRQLNQEQRQFFNVKVQQAYLEALQFCTSSNMVNTDSTWRL